MWWAAGKQCRLDWDFAGIAASGLCAIHCLLLPIALPFLSFLHCNAWLEIGIILSAVVAGAFALRHGFAHHSVVWPSVVWVAGITLLVFGHWETVASAFGKGHHRCADGAQTYTIAAGATLIVGSHISNILFHRRAHRIV